MQTDRHRKLLRNLLAAFALFDLLSLVAFVFNQWLGTSLGESIGLAALLMLPAAMLVLPLVDAVLDGAKNAYRDISVLNAAGALVIAGKAGDLKEGVKLAALSLDTGAARDRLERLIAVSQAHTVKKDA